VVHLATPLGILVPPASRTPAFRPEFQRAVDTLSPVRDTFPIMMLSGHLYIGARYGAQEPGREGRIMDPVTAAVVTAIINAVGTVLAAWVQGRTPWMMRYRGRPLAGPCQSAPESQADDRQ
jgi:hypothetical protein